VEHAKSSILLETLNRNIAIKGAGIPDSVNLNINDLKLQAAFLDSEINRIQALANIKSADSVNLASYKSSRLQNKLEFQELMIYLEKTFPNYYDANYNNEALTIEKVQQKLKPGEAIVEYFEGTDNTYAFTISKDTAVVAKLEKISHEEINQFRQAIIPTESLDNSSANYQQFISKSHQFYEKLLSKPIAALQGKSINKLIIIPDKSLNYVSFDLLLTKQIEKNNRKGYVKLPYLINDFDISYAYSASILFRDSKKQKPGSENANVLAFAPTYESLISDTTELNKLGEYRDGFSPLKFNQSEVDLINRYFNTSVFKAEQATKQSFLDNLENYDIVHLAMHGLVDKKDSENSKLIFTMKRDSIHDNYLHNFELYNMNIPVKLAVLSACNTGYGKLEGGEGVMSIARAFTYAGAKAVVMSQWPADDESSSIIMEYFYKYLSQGKAKDESLRLAKLEFLQEAKPAKQNPFFWNNFVVIGDTSPIVSVNSWYGKWWVFILTVAIFIVLIIYLLKISNGKKQHVLS